MTQDFQAGRFGKECWHPTRCSSISNSATFHAKLARSLYFLFSSSPIDDSACDMGTDLSCNWALVACTTALHQGPRQIELTGNNSATTTKNPAQVLAQTPTEVSEVLWRGDILSRRAASSAEKPTKHPNLQYRTPLRPTGFMDVRTNCGIYSSRAAPGQHHQDEEPPADHVAPQFCKTQTRHESQF